MGRKQRIWADGKYFKESLVGKSMDVRVLVDKAHTFNYERYVRKMLRACDTKMKSEVVYSGWVVVSLAGGWVAEGAD